METKRFAFKMKLYPGFKEEYRKRHAEIWPELVMLLKNEGIGNYSIFLDEETNTLFAYQEQSGSSSSQDLGKFVQDGVAMVADNIQISGLLPVENYYEKSEKITEAGVDYAYNCSVLVELAVSDYKTARNKAVEGLAAEARAKNDKKAEETAVKLLEKLQ